MMTPCTYIKKQHKLAQAIRQTLTTRETETDRETDIQTDRELGPTL